MVINESGVKGRSITKAKMNLGLRVMRSQDIASLNKEVLSTITKEDIAEIFEPQSRKKAKIPMYHGSLHA